MIGVDIRPGREEDDILGLVQPVVTGVHGKAQSQAAAGRVSYKGNLLTGIDSAEHLLIKDIQLLIAFLIVVLGCLGIDGKDHLGIQLAGYAGHRLKMAAGRLLDIGTAVEIEDDPLLGIAFVIPAKDLHALNIGLGHLFLDQGLRIFNRLLAFLALGHNLFLGAGGIQLFLVAFGPGQPNEFLNGPAAEGALFDQMAVGLESADCQSQNQGQQREGLFELFHDNLVFSAFSIINYLRLFWAEKYALKRFLSLRRDTAVREVV